MIITNQGKLIRVEAKGIRVSGRSTQGVKLIDASDGDLVTSASLIERQQDATEEPESWDEDEEARGRQDERREGDRARDEAATIRVRFVVAPSSPSSPPLLSLSRSPPRRRSPPFGLSDSIGWLRSDAVAMLSSRSNARSRRGIGRL